MFSFRITMKWEKRLACHGFFVILFLIDEENCTWNLETSIRGAKERLPSILMTALVAGLALTPIAFGSDQPGKEIEGPMAMIIIGGLFT